ncbi:hypothetical protein EROM_050800 [Encephalitozoon romaleae SJ-2008]|uniref:Uncharacterized protein n=1 Tax=Encephalitozoon romaleae (strain SJ-2008) TaxID=1178016 RepID=I7ARL0_ENCRO|nr:hypothetical protein EROM_050800 [Encephalitozoon romaleae SJ-2008]AFN83012.1 hypothetical protein EROM_050800 [Encephalitozoon romaleae SJ-2008]
MLRLYEGMIFVPYSPPECTFVQIIHRKTIRILPGEKYNIPVCLNCRPVFDNIYVHTGESSLMTVNYIQTYTSEEGRGILSYREFQDIKVTRQKILRSEIYEVYPPFSIREYFDGTFLFLKLEELFEEGAIKKYEVYSERNERLKGNGSIYKIYPDRRYDQEYVILGEEFVFRFQSRCVFACPFYFNFWAAEETVYFVAKARNRVLEVECPGLASSDTSKGMISLPLDQFNKQGRFLYIGDYSLRFSPEFYNHCDSQ